MGKNVDEVRKLMRDGIAKANERASRILKYRPRDRKLVAVRADDVSDEDAIELQQEDMKVS